MSVANIINTPTAAPAITGAYAGGGSGAGVSSLNGLSGTVNIVAGTNVTVTPGVGTITIASSGGSGATSVQVAQGPGALPAAQSYNFIPTFTGSYLIELTTILRPAPQILTVPSGSYMGYFVSGGPFPPSNNDYGCSMAGVSLVQPFAPQTQTHFVMSSSFDLIGGNTYSINVYNNSPSSAGISGTACDGWVIEATGPL